MQGLRTIVRLNGELVTDYDGVSPVPARKHGYEPERGPRPEYGYIGLQHHDDRAIIEFREVELRALKSRRPIIGHGLDHLAVAHDGFAAIVTLNRPQRRNALSLALMAELIACLDGDRPRRLRCAP